MANNLAHLPLAGFPRTLELWEVFMDIGLPLPLREALASAKAMGERTQNVGGDDHGISSAIPGAVLSGKAGGRKPGDH